MCREHGERSGGSVDYQGVATRRHVAPSTSPRKKRTTTTEQSLQCRRLLDAGCYFYAYLYSTTNYKYLYKYKLQVLVGARSPDSLLTLVDRFSVSETSALYLASSLSLVETTSRYMVVQPMSCNCLCTSQERHQRLWTRHRCKSGNLYLPRTLGLGHLER